MNLQKLLVTLRGEESIPAAAKRIGLSPNYYRYIEKGYDTQRQVPINPSRETLEKIAKAYKVDFNVLAKAAGMEVKEKANLVAFSDDPILHQWYKTLPYQNRADIEMLHGIWTIIKGRDGNVL